MTPWFLHLVVFFCFDMAKGTETDHDTCAHGASQGESLIQVNRIREVLSSPKLELASLSIGSGLGLSARIGRGFDQDMWASNSESQFGHAHMKFWSCVGILSSWHILALAIVLALLGVLLAFVARSSGSTDSSLQVAQVPTSVAQRDQIHKHADTKLYNEQVPVIPALRLLKSSGPQYQPEILPHSHAMMSSQVSSSIARDSIATSSCMSGVSIGSRMCPSAGVYPPPSALVLASSTNCEQYAMTARRSTGSLRTLSPYRNRASGRLAPLPEVAASGASGVHYMMTARNGGSVKSTRTPSPYRNSFRHAFPDVSHMSPIFTNASNLRSNTCEHPEHGRIGVTASQAEASTNMYPRGRAPTASMEGLKGVKGRVEWFNLGTPRPPEGCASYPTPRTGF